MNTPFFLTLSLTGVSLAILSAPTPAQAVGGTEDLKYRIDGSAGTGELGCSISNAGDVDADGFDDVIVGAQFSNHNGIPLAGSAFVLSGPTGAQIFRFDGQTGDEELGVSVSGAGDVNGDGFSDLIVGSWKTVPPSLGRGSAFVFSGASGVQLFRFDAPLGVAKFGFSVSGAGDVDGDGFPDVIVGAWDSAPNGLTRAGSAFVYSGSTGAQLFRFDGQAAYDGLGVSVSGAGDVDGDGFADLIVGAFGADPNGLMDAGSAFVFSGSTGSQLIRFDGNAASEGLGRLVSGAGDVDGDGFPDLIVGAPSAAPGGINWAGSAIVFSGATGAQVLRFDGLSDFEGMGRAISGAGDINGDGLGDLIVGAAGADPNGLGNAGSAFVFSGATGAQLFRGDGLAAQDAFGSSVSGGGDVDGDGRPDLMVGARYAKPNGNGSGSAFIYTFNPILTASSETFSISSGGTIDYAIDFPDADGGKKYGVLLSAKGTGPTLFKGLLIPLRKDKYFVASLQGNTPSQGVNFQGVLDPQGQALAHFTAPAHSLPSRMIGHSLFLAAVNKNFDFASVARRIDFTL